MGKGRDKRKRREKKLAAKEQAKVTGPTPVKASEPLKLMLPPQGRAA